MTQDLSAQSLIPGNVEGLLALANPKRSLYLEDPVTIEEFILSKRYGNQAASAWRPIIDELIGVFGTDPYGFANQEAIFKWAIGAGKSFAVSSAFAYMLYCTLNLRDPQDYYGLAPGTTIVWINQSFNEEQAKRVIFHEVSNRIRQAPWFKEHGFLPDPKIRSELRFPKDIVVFPGNSRMEFPAGYALLGGVIDEAAHFQEKAERIPGREREDPADVIYNSMLLRMRSRFGSRGLLMAISNPKHAEDFIERSYTFAKFGNPENEVPPPPRTYASHKALWHTKPGHEKDPETKQWIPWNLVPFEQTQTTPDGRREVTFRMMVPDVYLPDFLKDPEGAKCNLAAIASRIGMGYFADPEVVAHPGIVGQLPGCNAKRFHPFNELNQLWDGFKWPHGLGGTCHAHVDLSLTRDACGVALGHINGMVNVYGEPKPLIVVDFMLELHAPPGGEIDFQDVRNLLYMARDVRGFPLNYVSYDGWQSVDSIQQMRKRGIEAEVLSVDRDMSAYDTFKEAVYEARLDYYFYQPMVDCVKSLVLIKGKKVDHTPKGKKDVTDGLAAICQTLTERWMIDVRPAAGSVQTPVSASVGGRRTRYGSQRRRAVVT